MVGPDEDVAPRGYPVHGGDRPPQRLALRRAALCIAGDHSVIASVRTTAPDQARGLRDGRRESVATGRGVRRAADRVHRRELLAALTLGRLKLARLPVGEKRFERIPRGVRKSGAESSWRRRRG